MMRMQMARLICSGLFLAVAPAVAHALVGDDATGRKGLSGSAELRYISHDAAVDGRKVLDASSFVQQYSLLYNTYAKSGKDSNASYKLAVGYEWSAIDASVWTPGTSTEQTVRSGRFLYDGSLKFNPPTSPISLTAYSRDMGRSSMSSDTLTGLGATGGIISPDMPTEINSYGSNIESGISLVIANKARVRQAVSDLLAGMPVMYVDYNNTLRLHEGRQSMYDKLKISAGGLGSTWLHYQVSSYTDSVNTDNNYKKSAIVLGTINQYQRRSWIQFTNWIKLSADARFISEKQDVAAGSREEFDLNIFGLAERRRWYAKLFSNYNRTSVGGGVTEDLRLPLYVSGVMGPDTDWSVNVATRNHREGSVGSLSSSREDVLSMRINTLKRSPFTLSSALALHDSSDSAGGGDLGADLNLETVSTSRFARNLNLVGSYALRTRYNRVSKTYSYNQDLLLSAHSEPSPEWKLTIKEKVTQGKNDTATTDFNRSQVAQEQNPLGRITNLKVPSASFLRASTELSVSWRPVARFTASLSGTNYVQIEDDGTSMANAVGTSISYSQQTYNFNLTGSAAMQDNGNKDLSGQVAYTYRPTRDLEAGIRGVLVEQVSSGTTYRFMNVAQRLSYYVWGGSGFSRKLADLYEELSYAQDTGETPKKSLSLAGTYYVFSRVTLNGRAVYSLQNGALTQAYGLGLGANLKLFNASVDYTYAKRSTDKRVENRLAATLKKTF